MANKAPRASASGKSTKKISSKRPLRSISGGKLEILLEVAARKTLLLWSCIQVSSVANRRWERPASASPLELAEAKAFSISSIHITTGASFCASSSALSAPLHARNQHAFRRHQTKALPFRSQRVAAFINPLAQMLESGDVEESGIAANRLQHTVRLKRGALGVQHRIKKSGIGHAARKQAAAKRSRGVIFRQAHQIVRKLCDGRSVESHEDAAIAAGFGQNLIHAERQFVRIGQSQLKRNRIAFQFRRQFNRGGGDHDGAACAAEFIREITQTPADAIVVTIARKISEQKDGAGFNERDVGERLFGLGGAVEG